MSNEELVGKSLVDVEWTSVVERFFDAFCVEVVVGNGELTNDLDSAIDAKLGIVAEDFDDSRRVGVLLSSEKELECCVCFVEIWDLVNDEDLLIAIGVWVDTEEDVECFVGSVGVEVVVNRELTSVLVVGSIDEVSSVECISV